MVAADNPRYRRNLLLDEIGLEGQKRLLSCRVCVVGAGGLGSAVLPALAAAGVGNITIIDNDEVEASNLNRQTLYTPNDYGCRKVKVAAEKLKHFNPGCEVQPVDKRLLPENMEELLHGYDVILDCTDNFPTRFLIVDAARLMSIPLVSASAQRFSGQLLVQLPFEGCPCYRCLLPQPPRPGSVPLPAETGVFGPVVSVMGSLQATEACKVITEAGKVLSHELLDYDGLNGRIRTMTRQRDPACPLCGDNPTITDYHRLVQE